jgi:hypothetical protein
MHMGQGRIRGHEPLHHLDATGIGGTATAVDERGIIAHPGIVIVIVMPRHRVVGGTTRKKRLLLYPRLFRGSSAHCQGLARSMVRGLMCRFYTVWCLTTMQRTCIPHGRFDASFPRCCYSKRDWSLSKSSSCIYSAQSR